MPIIFNGTTFNNGGTAIYNGTSLTSIKYGTTEVWRKKRTLTGGSVSWNNIQTSQTETYCTWTNLGGFSTLSIPFSGYVSSANKSGDSWNIVLRLLLNGGTTVTIKNWTSDTTISSATYTVNISGYTASQLSTVKVQAVGAYSYSDATGRYTYNNTTVGTTTAQ